MTQVSTLQYDSSVDAIYDCLINGINDALLQAGAVKTTTS